MMPLAKASDELIIPATINAGDSSYACRASELFMPALRRYSHDFMEKNMTDAFKKGDKVEWHSAQGTVHGTVEKKLTSPTRIKGHEVAASPDNPEYLVVSDKTGAEAAHKPDALRKR
jgi:hypothetical protein